ncbi:MAG: hypothetical protein AAF611_12770 [Bacteroidota bacterium]
MKRFLCYILFGLTLFSCDTKQNFTFQKLDSYEFHRNYSKADSLQGAALDTYINRNPTTNLNEETTRGPFYEYLTKADIIKDNALQLSKLDTLYNTFNYTVNDETFLVTIDFKYLSKDDTNNFIFAFSQEEEIIIQDTLRFGFPPDVIFSKNDLDKNGVDELYALFKNYAAEGDNFELSIYELK